MDRGWYSFFEIIRGYKFEVTSYFSKNYIGLSINSHTLIFELNEVLIIEAMGLPAEGERWFKKNLFEINLSVYLLSGYKTLDWSKGIHLNILKWECRDVLDIIQCCTSCEGMFATILGII